MEEQTINRARRIKNSSTGRAKRLSRVKRSNSMRVALPFNAALFFIARRRARSNYTGIVTVVLCSLQANTRCTECLRPRTKRKKNGSNACGKLLFIL